MRRLGIIGPGAGDSVPLIGAFERVCLNTGTPCSVHEVLRPEQVRDVDLLVLASARSFASLSMALADGMGEAIVGHIGAGKPLLGISVGMQVLFESAEGAPGAAGLGVLPGVARMLAPEADPISGARLRARQIGWNRLMIEPGRCPVLDAVGRAGTWAYFSHSLHVEPGDRSIVVATTDHGARPIVAAVRRDNVIGTQFRPDKSHRAGTRMLVAYVEQR
ncbi:MAG: hypothetical protein HY898_11805 [Deltaproteobacteria bacterium]|nr:hypothetical protein [Deltaproteobacteria bacterium]